MNHIVPALIPIFSLILLGYFFKRIKFPSYEFWPMADKLTYYILMPSLLVYKLSNASLDAKNSFNFIITPIIVICIILFILILINKVLKFKGESFTSVVQGAIRFNTYIFLALSDSIFADEGLVLAALILTFVIPFINIVCITIFAIFVSSNKLSFLDLFKSVISNPLIIACALGGLLNFFDLKLPIVLNNIVSILGEAALPMGLLSVGFGLVLKEIKDNKKEIITSSLAKLVLFPVLTLLLSKFFNLNDLMSSILIIFASLATAPSSFVLARQLGGDIKLMSSIITIETLLSIFVIILALEFIL